MEKLKRLEARVKKARLVEKKQLAKKIRREKIANSVPKLSKKADDLWSLLVKKIAHNKCEYCGSNQNLNSHHIFSRKNKSTRWEIANGICLCAKHHVMSTEFSAHKTPTEFTFWLEDKYGHEWLKKLAELARELQHVDSVFLKETIVSFQKMLDDF